MSSSLSEHQKTELLISTKGMADAFLEDMAHIRDVIARRDTSRGELRRLSAVLRRLLVDRDMAKISTPRLDRRLTFSAPDRKPFYAAEKRMRCLFFASGGAPLFGVLIDATAMWNAGKIQAPKSLKDAFPEYVADPDTKVAMRLDNFLAQRVLCYRGNWASRKAAIQYVANFASGVHSTTPKSDEDKLIERMRASCTYRIVDGKFERHVMPELGSNSFRQEMLPAKDAPPFDFAADQLDPVLLEVLAAASLVASSPDVMELEEIVRKELYGR